MLSSEIGAKAEEVWFDRNVIEPGDNFRRLIFDGIKTCHFFIPVISRAADARQEAFFRIEWRKATKRLEQISPIKKFVLPLIVDADYAPGSYKSLDDDWYELDFMHAPEGKLDERSKSTVVALLREAHLENHPYRRSLDKG